MTKSQEAKIDRMGESLTDVTIKVGDIHKVLYEEGLVHEVNSLSAWRNTVNRIGIKVLTGIILAFLGTLTAAIVFYVKNSN